MNDLDDTDSKRDNYTWVMFSKDLALATNLTLREAIEISVQLEKANVIHPYDAYVPVSRMVIALITRPPGNSGVALFAINLAKFAKESY